MEARAQAPGALFAAYQALCLSADGDPTRALAAAQASGWSQPAASDMLPLEAFSVGDGQQREKQVSGVRLHLAVGHASDPAQLGAGSTPWRVCIVTQEPPDPAAARALQAWAGVPSMRDLDASPGSALFAMSGPQNGRRTVQGLSGPAIHALVQAGDLTAAGVKSAGTSTILLYARPGG